MPLYEYKCHHCGKTFEVRQKFSDAPLQTHAECGGGPVEKLLSAPAFHLKGSGWYVTDYGKGNNAKAGEKKAESSSDAKTETKAETKSDSTASGSSDSKSDAKPKPASTESKPAA